MSPNDLARVVIAAAGVAALLVITGLGIAGLCPKGRSGEPVNAQQSAMAEVPRCSRGASAESTEARQQFANAPTPVVVINDSTTPGQIARLKMDAEILRLELEHEKLRYELEEIRRKKTSQPNGALVGTVPLDNTSPRKPPPGVFTPNDDAVPMSLAKPGPKAAAKWTSAAAMSNTILYRCPRQLTQVFAAGPSGVAVASNIYRLGIPCRWQSDGVCTVVEYGCQRDWLELQLENRQKVQYWLGQFRAAGIEATLVDPS